MSKKMPASIEAEQAVLGGLLLDNESWYLVDGIISKDDFYRTDHALIYDSIGGLADKKKPFDVITLSECLAKKSVSRQGELIAYLGELAKNTPSSANIVAYAEIVKEKSKKRELIESLSSLLDSCYTRSGLSIPELVSDAQQSLMQITGETAESKPKKIADLFSEAIDYVESVGDRDSKTIGLPTGFREIDFLTGGLQQGELIVLAARPSMGKTSLALNITHNAIKNSDRVCLFFSLEMPSRQLILRLFSSFGGVNQNRIRQGSLNNSDWQSISKTTSELSDANLYIDDSPGLTLQEIRSRAYRVASERGIGLIVVDYLQLIQSKTRYESRTAEVSAISLGLKGLAKELNVPVLALSQLNRNLENRPNKRPALSDLRDSGAVEQDSDLVLFIYRDEVYNENSPDTGTAEIIIGKHRNGPTGIVRLKFSGELTRFEDL